jgi:genome maintenance exonuclease 1
MREESLESTPLEGKTTGVEGDRPIPDLLPTISAKSVRQGGKSFFVDSHGVRLPSVTTILNATKPQADREALARWRSRLGTEEAARVTSQASRRGTQTHQYIKKHLLGQPFTCPDGVRPYWDGLAPILADVDGVQLVESSVFHSDLGYAGTVDCVASYQGIPCIVDWKTSDRPKASVNQLYDGPLQLAAYCGAVNHSYHTHQIRIRHALIVVAIADQPAQVFWFEADDVMQYWQQWQERLAEYYRRYR